MVMKGQNPVSFLHSITELYAQAVKALVALVMSAALSHKNGVII